MTMVKYVDVEALNLRSSPDLAQDNRIAILHLGQRVEESASPPKPGWVSIRTQVGQHVVEGFVKAEIDPQPLTGFVAKPSLRAPVSDVREALVAEAIKEWLRFEKGKGKEHQEPFFRYVGEMWKALDINLDGRDRDVPWSAAAISYMVRNASKSHDIYKNFRFAAAHSRFMHDAIARQTRNDRKAPFWGVRIHENPPQIGDIVGKWRETPRDFDDAARSDSFKSHTDIIVSVAPDYVLAIGGNVGQSVNITRYKKSPSGHLADDDGVFILLVNQG
jgi:hypothetical protein